MHTYLFMFLFSSVGFAFIPKPSTILQKVVENNGSGIYSIEQEVQFPSVGEPIVLKELWTVENENKMRLVVTGTRDLKDKLKWSFLYENGVKSYIQNGSKQSRNLDENFIEKYFHYRKLENFQSDLISLKILSPDSFAKRPFVLDKNTEKSVVYFPDRNVRLSRIGGGLAYALGAPTSGSSSELPANFFIEQDQFVIRKLRLPSSAEVLAEKFSSYARGLLFPRLRTVRWEDKLVTMQTTHVQARTEKNMKFVLEGSTSFNVPDFSTSANLIEEFYKRFR